MKLVLAHVAHPIAAYPFAQALVTLLLVLQIFLAICSAFFQNERLFKMIKVFFVTETVITVYTLHTVVDCFVLADLMMDSADTIYHGDHPRLLDVFVYLLEALFILSGQFYIRRLSRG